MPSAVDALVRSIHLVDDPSPLRSKELSEHIQVAATRSMVVPLALLLCKAPCDAGVVRHARERLAAHPVLRTLVAELAT